MRVLVIGAGAVGGFLGARAALSGHEVALVGRSRFVAAVRSEGLVLLEVDGTRRTAPVRAVETVAQAFAAPARYDLVLLTVKAYDTSAVTLELRSATPAVPPIVTLQNGVGNEEVLAEAFGADSVIAGALETPVSVTSPGQVQIHRARFRAGLAPVGVHSPLPPALALLRDAGCDIRSYGDHRALKWSKLLLNLPANAQCAILDWTPAQVMSHSGAARLEARAWQEAFRVLHGLRIRTLNLAGYPLPLIAPFARALPPALLARGLASIVSGGRGTKLPSLQMAINSGQRSEVGWLNGAVARAGCELGISTPVNAVFTDVLAALAEGREPRESWRGHPEHLAARLSG